MQKIALLFPGQGSQSVGMGKSFIEGSAIASHMVQEASDRIHVDMKTLLLEPNELIDQTAYAQPAILLVSLIAYRLFEAEFETKPICAIGHSLGEISAVAASGALSDMDALYIVHQRGLWMQEACNNINAGMMVVLGLSDDIVSEICDNTQKSGKQVWPANFNADGQVVLAGKKSDLEGLEPILKNAGAKRCLLLSMSVASHCPILEPAAIKLNALLNDKMQDSFAFDIISNVTALPYSTKKDAVELLSRQLISPVLYKRSIKNVENSVDLFIEFGHGGVLAGLNKRGSQKPTKVVSDMNGLQILIESFAE